MGEEGRYTMVTCEYRSGPVPCELSRQKVRNCKDHADFTGDITKANWTSATKRGVSTEYR